MKKHFPQYAEARRYLYLNGFLEYEQDKWIQPSPNPFQLQAIISSAKPEGVVVNYCMIGEHSEMVSSYFCFLWFLFF